MEYILFTSYSLAIIAGAFFVSWATESAAILISQGFVLAILAWIQILPEFAVEATLAYDAGKDPSRIALVAANFTGSIRLLVGVGIPLIFLVRAIFLHHHARVTSYKLIIPRLHGIAIFGNLIPLLLFLIVMIKQSLSVLDGIILILIYILYLWFLKKTPPAEEESVGEMEFVPRNISKIKSQYFRWICIITLFLIGGVIFYILVHPFVEICEKIAIKIGLSAFIFIQWVAPFLTEFPEKLTVFYWAKNEKKAPIALLNLLNANIAQWTLLAATIPIVYFFTCGKYSIEWDYLHIKEIILTMSQTVFLVTLLLDRNLSFWDAILIFMLWLIQFIISDLREEMVYLYLGLSLIRIISCIIKKHSTKIYLDFLLLLKRTTKTH